MALSSKLKEMGLAWDSFARYSIPACGDSRPLSPEEALAFESEDRLTLSSGELGASWLSIFAFEGEAPTGLLGLGAGVMTLRTSTNSIYTKTLIEH